MLSILAEVCVLSCRVLFCPLPRALVLIDSVVWCCRCSCNVGFAGNLTERNGTAYIECLRCPKGARCDIEGVDYKNMSTLSGWWQVRSFDSFCCVLPIGAMRCLRCLSSSVLAGSLTSCLTADATQEDQTFYRCLLATHCAGGYSQIESLNSSAHYRSPW